jgi:hypothetical protein
MSKSWAIRHLLIQCGSGFSRSPAAFAQILAQAMPRLSADAIAAEVLRERPNARPNLRMIELGDRMLDRCGTLVEVASRIYQCRLEQDPGLAEMIIANGRAREVEAGRAERKTCLPPALKRILAPALPIR